MSNKTKLLISGGGGSVFPYLFDKLESNYDVYVMDSDVNVKKLYPTKNIIIVQNIVQHIAQHIVQH